MRYLIHVKVQHLGRLFKTEFSKCLQRGHSNRGSRKKIVQSQRFMKTKDSQLFLHTDIHKYEGCFLRGQVSSNGFKVFNGFIVEYLNFIGLFEKKLDNLLFSENVVIGQSSSKYLGFECSHCVTKLCSEQFSVCQTLFIVYHKQLHEGK